MFEINALNPSAIDRLGKQFLYDYGKQFKSFESAAQQCVTDIFQQFVGEDGSPAFALVRIFRAGRCQEVPSDLQALIDRSIPSYLCLMGSYGLESAWCDRYQSKTRRAIPITSGMSPMFKGVFKEMGFQWEDNSGDMVPSGSSIDLAMTRYFYIPQADQSSYITDLANFIEPYGIQSVVAFGSPFLSRAAYTLIAFSHYAITPENAEIFAGLTVYISTLLASYESRNAFWD